MEIHWGKGSSFNLGRIPDNEVRVERVKDQNGEWYFLLSDSKLTYLYCDNSRYKTIDELTVAVEEWLRMKGRI